MGDLGVSDLHGDCRQPCSNGADPVVTTHHGERLSDRFVEGLRRDVQRMRGIVQIVNDDGAGLEGHDGNLS